jgi:uncharacterized protein YeeX (DUF496 family)
VNKINECLYEVKKRIEVQGIDFKVIPYDKALFTNKMMNIYKGIYDYFDEDTYEIPNESRFDIMKETLATGICRDSYLETDRKIEQLLSFKDMDRRLIAFKKQISELRKEIRKAYFTVLLILGYDCDIVSGMSFEQIRGLTIGAIDNEFAFEIFNMSEDVSTDKDHIVFVRYSDEMNDFYSIINEIIRMLIEEWKRMY